ncbi:alpha/beta hydrolase [Psychromonas sp. KJ10-10]|uniref:alpha/beta hydrolase n=1 Tax=Psychromonas sp. KJ10-10 TaxID=3391823 RepID=UPI0039B44222
MSTYYATKNVIDMTEANQQLNISIMHGSMDSVVPARLGEQALQTLTSMGLNPSFNLYPMQHTVCMAQVKDISDWLKLRLG